MLGAGDPEQLAELVDAVGPVPAFLRQVCLAGGATDPYGVREALGPMMRELAEAVDIVSARSQLADRLELLAQGTQPFDQEPDFALLRAGLVAVHGKSGPKETSMRSPLIRSLVVVDD
ncbi:MAG: hypothetical protein KC621_31135 [Myxococcales bacterium]|nr:hypothetical protein [Myxococcales bacterium]